MRESGWVFSELIFLEKFKIWHGRLWHCFQEIQFTLRAIFSHSPFALQNVDH